MDPWLGLNYWASGFCAACAMSQLINGRLGWAIVCMAMSALNIVWILFRTAA